MKTARNSATAVSYARALLDLANQHNAANDVGQEMSALAQVLQENPLLRVFLSNPAVVASKRLELLDKLFKGQASQLVYNLIRVADQKGRAGMLGEIASAYAKLLDEQFGNVDVEVTSAQELEDSQAEAIGQRVSELLGKNTILHRLVNESIIGGLVVRVGDKVMDASVKTQLKAMRRRLLAGSNGSVQ